MTEFGRFDRRVTIRRRPVTGAVSRGPYADAFTIWGRFVTANVRELVEGGRAQDVETGVLTVRLSTQTRGITIADRVVIDGRDFAIDGVSLPDTRHGLINLSVASKLGGQ